MRSHLHRRARFYMSEEVPAPALPDGCSSSADPNAAPADMSQSHIASPVDASSPPIHPTTHDELLQLADSEVSAVNAQALPRGSVQLQQAACEANVVPVGRSEPNSTCAATPLRLLRRLFHSFVAGMASEKNFLVAI